MDIRIERVVPLEEGYQRLRQAPLDAAGEASIRVYQDAVMRLGTFCPKELNPTSLYVLRSNLEVQLALREQLLDRYGIDTLKLSSLLHLRDGTMVTGMAPPFVEIYDEQVQIIAKPGDRTPPQPFWLRIPILKDGIHRAWLAEEFGMPMHCIVVHGAPREHLPYIYPNEWSQVSVYDAVPPQKKFYRRQEPYTFMRPLRVLRQTEAITPPPQWGR